MGALKNEASGDGLGGLPRSVLAERMAKSKEVLLAVMRRLGHPHVDSYERATLEVLEQQVLLAARFHRDTWSKAQKPHVIDVAAMAVLDAGLDAERVHGIFGGVSLERDLTAPVKKWLEDEHFTVRFEVPVKDCRADLVGYKQTFFGREIVLVELKNSPDECARLAEQIASYRPVGDAVRVVMTPECLAKMTLTRNELEIPERYAESISKLGAQLWAYDAAAEKFTRLGSGSGTYDGAAFNALWESLRKSESRA
jgi:hypothetical protein